MIILAPISVGELLDKLSILYIKLDKIKDQEKLMHVAKEASMLEAIVDNNEINRHADYKHLMARLALVNTDLWDLEDKVRDLYRAKDIGHRLIQTAQAIHLVNDKRMKVKGIINTTYNSGIVEVKSYKEF
jgi:hypothetical protein